MPEGSRINQATRYLAYFDDFWILSRVQQQTIDQNTCVVMVWCYSGNEELISGGEPRLISEANVAEALQRVEGATRSLPKAVMYALADDGFRTPFELLVSCIISIRTLEEVTEPTSRALFARVRTPREIHQMPLEELNRILARATFHESKAPQIKEIARRIVEEMDGELIAAREVLLSFRGVGPKCANLVLAISGDVPYIGVDTHVHRVMNRWGFVQTKTPEKTLVALEAKLLLEYWNRVNPLLVPFGKYICTFAAPRCSTCPVFDLCPRIGVSSSR